MTCSSTIAWGATVWFGPSSNGGGRGPCSSRTCSSWIGSPSSSNTEKVCLSAFPTTRGWKSRAPPTSVVSARTSAVTTGSSAGGGASSAFKRESFFLRAFALGLLFVISGSSAGSGAGGACSTSSTDGCMTSRMASSLLLMEWNVVLPPTSS